MINKNDVLELEKKVWEALMTGDIEADRKLLSDKFLGVYSDGFAVKNDHIEQLEKGPSISDYSILDSKIINLSEDTVLLAYKASWQRISSFEPEFMYVTSIWKLADGNWKNIFSQDTPAVSE